LPPSCTKVSPIRVIPDRDRPVQQNLRRLELTEVHLIIPVALD
jgi:hypothetical protein